MPNFIFYHVSCGGHTPPILFQYIIISKKKRKCNRKQREGGSVTRAGDRAAPNGERRESNGSPVKTAEPRKKTGAVRDGSGGNTGSDLSPFGGVGQWEDRRLGDGVRTVLRRRVFC